MADRGIPHSGLTVLYEPPPGRDEPIADIIFVHGIQGHPYRTWRAENPSAPAQNSDAKRGSRSSSRFGEILKSFRTKEAKTQETATALVGADAVAGEPQNSDVFWPQDLLPKQCPDARILTWGYDSMVAKLSGAINKIGIFAHANNFMYALGRDHKPDRPIVFVAHSLGGILVKEMLVNAEVSENPSHLNIITSTAAVVFMGTPHRGSQDLAGLGEVVRKVASLMLMDTNPSVLDSLGLRNDDLLRSNRTFTRLWRKHDFRVKTFEEGSGLTRVDFGLLNKKVVPEISSTLGDPREEAETLLGNHMDICRISSVNDPKFPIVAGELRSICQKLGKRPEAQGKQTQRDFERQIATEKAFQALIQSLSFEHMYLREHSINAPQEGTCTWLPRHEDFQKWLSNTKDPPDRRCGLLWLKGKPGSGKSSAMKATMLSSQSGERLIARFFFDQRSEIELNRSSTGLFRSIMYQLVSQDEGIRQSFLTMHSHQAQPSNHESAIKWTSQDLKSMLRALIMSNQVKTSQILIFIDAIDECERTDSRDILMYFRDLVEKAHSTHVLLRVCVSSRPFPNISVSNCLEIAVDELNQGDIVAYVSRQLSMSGVPDDKDWRRITDTISQKARGVFLWAILTTNLALEYHDQGESMEAIHRRLTVVPPQLADLYADILGDLHYDCFITYRFFQWAILSTTSLRLREWYEILPWIHQEEPPVTFSDLRESEFFAESDDQLEQKIRSISRGLVEVIKAPTRWRYCDEVNSEAELRSAFGEAGSLDLETGETRGVQVIHESVLHFFLNQNGFAVLLELCNQLKASRPGWIDDMPSAAAPLNDILIHGHYSMMKSCLEYQRLTEVDAIVSARDSVASKVQRQIEMERLTKNLEKSKRSPRRAFKSKRSSRSLRSPPTSPSRSGSILSFTSAGSSIDTDQESLSHLSSHRLELDLRRSSRSQDKRREPLSVMLRRYLEEGIAEDSALRFFAPTHRAVPAAASVASSTSKKTTAQQAFLSLQHYAITQLFVHAKMAEDLGAKPDPMISLLEPHWKRLMLLQENYQMPNILDFSIDIDLPSWILVLLDVRGHKNAQRKVFDAFRRAFDQDSPETLSAIVVDDIIKAEKYGRGSSILGHIITSGNLEMFYAWNDIVSTALRLELISPNKLEQLIREPQNRPPSEYGDYNDHFYSAGGLGQKIKRLARWTPELSRAGWLKKIKIMQEKKRRQHKNVLSGIIENNQSSGALERE